MREYALCALVGLLHQPRVNGWRMQEAAQAAQLHGACWEGFQLQSCMAGGTGSREAHAQCLVTTKMAIGPAVLVLGWAYSSLQRIAANACIGAFIFIDLENWQGHMVVETSAGCLGRSDDDEGFKAGSFGCVILEESLNLLNPRCLKFKVILVTTSWD